MKKNVDVNYTQEGTAMNTLEEIKHVAISEAGTLVMSETFWTNCKELVEAVANKKRLSNTQKHKLVVKELMDIVGDIGETMFKIGIGAAVLWLKTKQTN